MGESKLRTFKLIDKVSFVYSDPQNKQITETYLDENNCISGYMFDDRLFSDKNGSGIYLINADELNHFEEILEMNESKLRTFKLIDQNGYFNSFGTNQRMFETYAQNDCFIGELQQTFPEIPQYHLQVGEHCVISEKEFRFFEEIESLELSCGYEPKIGDLVNVTLSDDNILIEQTIAHVTKHGYLLNSNDTEQYIRKSDIRDIHLTNRIADEIIDFLHSEFSINVTDNKMIEFNHLLSVSDLIRISEIVIEKSNIK